MDPTPTSDGGSELRGVALFARAARLPFLTATLVPVLVGTAVAAWQGTFHLVPFLLALAGAACFHVGTNVANDYFDHRSGADEANATPTPFAGGSRVIQQGVVSPGRMAALAAGAYAAGIAIGLMLVALLWPDGVRLVWLGLAGLAIGVFYTSPPLRLVHRGLGEVAVGVGFGPLVVLGAYFVQTRAFAWTPFVASIPVGMLIAAVLYINEFPDRAGDARAGKRTLVVRLPESVAIRGYAAFPAVAYAVVIAAVVAGSFPAWTLLALLSAPLAVRAAAVLRREHADPYRLVPANAMTVALHFATGMLLFAGFAIAAWSR